MTTKAIYHSTGSFISFGSIANNPINTDTMYTGGYRSTDGRETWHKMSMCSGYIINPLNPNRLFTGLHGKQLWVTGDAGVTWSFLYSFKNCLDLLRISPTDTSVLYASANDTTYGGIYKSNNSGATWGLTALHGPGPSAILSLTVSTSIANLIYVGTRGEGVFKPTDGGQTWSFVLPTEWASDIAVDPIDTNTVYVVTGEYLNSYVGNVF